MSARVAVLISGSGTLLQALIDDPARDYDIAVVVADRVAAGLERAQQADIPTAIVSPTDHADRDAWNLALADTVAVHDPDLVVSAGFMRILGSAFLERFPAKVINSHPALLPAFPGAHAVRDALAYGVRITGCTVHLVDDGVDTGPIIAQQAVEVAPDDDEASLHERIKTVEWTLLPQVVRQVLQTPMTVNGRKVQI